MKLTSLQKSLWALVGVAAVGFLSLLLWGDYRQDSTRSASEPAFTAAFELTDHRGSVRTQADFAGRWMLVFFGFTNCPDVCPTTLSDVATVMEGIGEQASRVQPLFISIDPERDTPSALAAYVPHFDSGIIGLTGTPRQIERTADTFKIYYEKIEEAAAPEGYTMAHTSRLFLFGPGAGYVASWQYGTPADEVLADLTELVSQ